MPPDDIKPGDWVVWSDFHNDQSDKFRQEMGPGPFKVQDVNDFGLFLYGTKYRCLYCKRFRKDTFITAVKKALKDA